VLFQLSFFETEVSSVPFQDSYFLWQLVLLPIHPSDFSEDPFLTQMGCDHSVFRFLVNWYKFVEKAKQFVDLLLWKVCIVRGILNFKCVNMIATPCDNVW